MPQAFTHLPVPKLSASTLALAEVCALALWNGLDYETGNPREFSDEDFLRVFATPTLAIVNKTGSRQNLQELNIRQLIRLSGLKALFRSSQATDFDSAIAGYRATAVAAYKGYKSNSLKLAHEYDYATKAILSWSVKFVTNTATPTRNGNHRVPLACRILFYAMPDMMIFNYSNALGKAMRLQSRPQAAIPHFNKLLFEGLERNKALLAKLNPPTPTSLDSRIWQTALKARWWERRVLDLALLLHFNCASATPQLQTRARQLAARWAVKKKP